MLLRKHTEIEPPTISITVLNGQRSLKHNMTSGFIEEEDELVNSSLTVFLANMIRRFGKSERSIHKNENV